MLQKKIPSPVRKKRIYRGLSIGISIIFGLSIICIYLLRYTSFLLFEKNEKILFLGVLLTFVFPYLALFSFFFLQKVSEWEPLTKRFLISCVIYTILSTICVVLFLKTPPFPIDYDIKIQSIAGSNRLSLGNEIKLLSLIRIGMPGQTEKAIENELEKSGIWVKNQIGFTHKGAGTASIIYHQYVQGEIKIIFATGPKAGKVAVTWNGNRQVIDLYAPVVARREIRLSTPFTFSAADKTRKICLIVLFLAEIVAVDMLLIWGFWLLEQIIISKTIRMRGAVVVLTVFLVTIPLLLIINLLEKKATFTDSHLELAIRQTLKIPDGPITYQQLQTIVTLDISRRGISSLEGIENLSNLEELHADYNRITKLSPLKNSHSLSIISLEGNQITDLKKAKMADLAGLPIKELNLNGNVDPTSGFYNKRLRDISLLKEFPLLEKLYLEDNNIQDISPLADLKNLRTLNLQYNKIHSLPDLCRLTSLQKLSLRGNQLIDIAPLHCLKRLQELNLHSNAAITSIEPLGNLINLKKLVLEKVPIRDQLKYLAPLTRLSYLNVSYCSLTDVKVLGDLMAKGALQDDPERQIQATLVVRGNPDLLQTSKPLQDIYPYWNHISFRDPPIFPVAGLVVPPPVFSQTGGLFSQGFPLQLSGKDSKLEIFYTLDGSEPDLLNLKPQNPLQRTYQYMKPISVKSRAGDPNVFSLFVTTKEYKTWLPEWHPPKHEVFKATVVRARAYNPVTKSYSKTVTQTYFVDRDIFERYKTLPIISLVADEKDLFDPETGIYTPAKPTGLEWDPYVYNDRKFVSNIEFYEAGGRPGFNGLFDVSLQGSTSRSSPQKGLNVIADGWYGNDAIQYPLLRNADSKANQFTSFKRFILRSWGSARDWPVIFSDAYNQTLLARADIEIEDYRPVIVFINGEYWGLQEIREAIKNPDYLSARTGLDPLNPGFDILDSYQSDADEGDKVEWDRLVDFVSTHDLSIAKNYTVVSRQVDIDNFITYIIHCVFTGKKDWPGHNEAKWRARVPGAKWRWLQYDMDMGLNSDGRPEFDMLAYIMDPEDEPHPLFNALLQNRGFREQFINTYADYLNTYFLTSVELEHFTKIANELDPYMSEYQDRWQLNEHWQKGKEYALDIIHRRATIRQTQLMKNFGLTGTYQITLKTDSAQGRIKINSITITKELPGVVDPSNWRGIYFDGLPIKITAIPAPGYRFDHWESAMPIDKYSSELTVTSHEDIALAAVFIQE